MSVEFVEDSARVIALVPAWSALTEQTDWPNVFYEPWYVLSAASQFQQTITHAFVWSEQHPERLVGYFPLCAGVKTGRARPKIAENWHHEFCFSGQPLIAKGQERMFWRAILKAIDETPRLGASVRLRALKGEGNSFEALISELQDSGRWYREYRRFRRAILHHDLSADAYLQANLTKKKRKEYRRQKRRLAELGELREDWLKSGDRLDEWVDAFLRLERSGWKGDEETAIASDETAADFFRRACFGAFEQSKLDIIKLSFNGAPIAMMVTFLARPFGNFTFKIAYDESYAKYSPGVLLELAYLERVLMDCAKGGWSDSCAAEDHPMINKLWRDRLELCSIKISPRRPIARLASIYDDVLTRIVTMFKN